MTLPHPRKRNSRHTGEGNATASGGSPDYPLGQARVSHRDSRQRRTQDNADRLATFLQGPVVETPHWRSTKAPRLWRARALEQRACVLSLPQLPGLMNHTKTRSHPDGNPEPEGKTGCNPAQAPHRSPTALGIRPGTRQGRGDYVTEDGEHGSSVQNRGEAHRPPGNSPSAPHGGPWNVRQDGGSRRPRLSGRRPHLSGRLSLSLAEPQLREQGRGSHS